MNQQVTTVTTTTMYSSLENYTNFHDDFQDISSGEKSIARVGTKTFDKTGTYITVKLYKKNEDGVFKCYQAVTLTTREFDFFWQIIIRRFKNWLKNKLVKRFHLLPSPHSPQL